MDIIKKDTMYRIDLERFPLNLPLTDLKQILIQDPFIYLTGQNHNETIGVQFNKNWFALEIQTSLKSFSLIT